MSADPSQGLESLYHAHRTDLLRFLVARTGSQGEAEDILQEVWIRARQPGAPIANGKAYLYRIAQNLVVDRAREHYRRMRRDRRWADETAERTRDGTEPIDPADDAEMAMLRREEIALIASALGNLPDGARRVFSLHKIEGYSHADVAARLGISKSGVEKHMAVAMKYLRRALLD